MNALGSLKSEDGLRCNVCLLIVWSWRVKGRTAGATSFDVKLGRWGTGFIDIGPADCSVGWFACNRSACGRARI